MTAAATETLMGAEYDNAARLEWEGRRADRLRMAIFGQNVLQVGFDADRTPVVAQASKNKRTLLAHDRSDSEVLANFIPFDLSSRINLCLDAYLPTFSLQNVK